MKFYFFILFFCSQRITDSTIWNEFVIWNVGQGSFNTMVLQNECIVWDIGGERFPRKMFEYVCRNKTMRVFISHDDRDHICFLNKLRGKKSFIRKSDSHTQIIHTGDGSSNEQSSVVYSPEWKILFPGDSTKEKEFSWKNDVSKETHGLILGHHGSKTSSSEELLSRLSNLKWAVASARQKKYGHPHPYIVERLRKFHVPLIRTEHWGHLRFFKKK